MARVKSEEDKCNCNAKIESILFRLDELIGRVESLEKTVFKPKPDVKSIQKVEAFNGEEIPEQMIKDSRMKMNEEETIENVRNIIKILPPNLVDAQGKQSFDNIRALGGPHLTDEIIEKAYEGVKIES